ncbi:MAG: LON peptidase substrate-binding domain-containing protein [Chitinophagales bacterium]|nr:LON peptidase substrate-binding domain-containing protein [Chitinophagales bacterium]
MTNFIPIFPLSVVVYPGEELNLHIFEPRYKQLITDCYGEKRAFGIPPVIDNKMQDYGSLVEITEVTKVYDNGEMDIKTTGAKVFRILELIKEVPDKLYNGAIVHYPENYLQGSLDIMRQILNGIREMYRFLQINKDFQKQGSEISTYDVAHHVGFSMQEEYELLSLMHERQRQEYLRRHLAKVIPILSELDQLKDKIKLNGHFKNLEGFDI